MEVLKKDAEPWKITLIDTGEKTLTGGRLKRVSSYLEKEKAFCFTYGDGVSDINISKSIKFHEEHGKLATVSAVTPPGRYGSLDLDGDAVKGFTEKPKGDGAVINGGFFVLSPKVIKLIEGDNVSWEEQPLTYLAENDDLRAFRHEGFWQPMDTLRDKNYLEDLWLTDQAPWKAWK
tara:strand:- start:8465 stop:8992 length:528 start_codon:yes stop_codon:yes gene_type:complete